MALTDQLCHPGLDPGSRRLGSRRSLPSTTIEGENDKRT